MKRTLALVAVLGTLGILSACDAAPTPRPPLALPAATNCSTDVTAALNAYLASQPDGSTVTLPAGACYRTQDMVVLRNRHHLTIDGNGATLRRVTLNPSRLARHLMIQTSSDIVVRNLKIEGEKPDTVGWRADTEGQAGIIIDASSNVEIDHVDISRVRGDFFYLSAGDPHVKIHDTTGLQAGRQGIAINCAGDVHFYNNVMRFTHRFSVDIEPMRSTDWVDGVVIAYNQLLSPTMGFIANNSGPRVKNVTIGANTQSW
jgi:polygalacturonase